ncbi:MAG: GWxTD domain-containing protein [candidate division WOR-3 bacterium]
MRRPAILLVLCACAQFKTLSKADRLSSEDRLEYIILTAIAPDAAQEFLTLPTARSRAEFLDWFWSQPQFATTHKQADAYRLYHERARQAQNFFGQLDLVNDDRVRTYIRYGPPHRELFDPKDITSETLRLSVSPAEIWTYQELGRQIDFVKSGTAFKIVGESRFGPRVSAPAWEPVDLGRPAPRPVPDARSLGLELSLYRLRQQAESVQVELGYGIPLREVLRLTQSRYQALVYFTIQLLARKGGSQKTLSFWAGTGAEPDSSLSDYVVGRELCWLPIDIYTVTMTAVSADGQAYSRRTAELNLIDYSRRTQPCSDVILYSLVDSTFQSPQFQRPDWQRVIPLPGSALRPGRTFYALYELYNLGTDSAGRHRIEVRYEILERERQQLAVVPLPDRFITGHGTTAVVVERVHTMNLNPGFYLLIGRINDLESGRTAALSVPFQILARQQ